MALFFYWHYFIEQVKTYHPYAIGLILLFIISVLLMGEGLSYPCAEFEHSDCRDHLVYFDFVNQVDVNCCECDEWDINRFTMYCRERGHPFPGDDNPDFNVETGLWQDSFDIPHSNVISVPKPNMGVELLAWFFFILALIGFGNVLRVFAIPFLASKKPKL